MADQSELRMNLAAIKRVDPYARDIIDSSAHVAFYTFNADDTEWEKTDVEGAFFIYSRTAEPLYSIFINNRLNTNSLVEPIAGQLELQSQPPFLLYRNERSRIRGFWFYNKTECDRIGELVDRLIKDTEKAPNGPAGAQNGTSAAKVSTVVNAKQPKQPNEPVRPANNINTTTISHSNNNGAAGGGPATKAPAAATSGVDIFTMLSKAQEDFNNAQSIGTPAQHPPATQQMGGGTPRAATGQAPVPQQQPQPQAQPMQPPQATTDVTSSVMNFFASAIPATAKEVPFFQRMLSQPMSVDQLEKQQQSNRSGTPQQPPEKQPSPPRQTATNAIPMASASIPVAEAKLENGVGFMRIASPAAELLGTSPLASFITSTNLSAMSRPSLPGSAVKSTDVTEIELRQQPLQQLLRMSDAPTNTPGKPALLLPTMFASAGATHLPPVTVGLNMDPATSLLRPIAKKSAADVHPHPSQAPANSVHTSANDTSFTKPEPLTQSQLLQAMNYLIKNDPDFVRKLHEAYLKSFTDMVSL